MRGADLSETHQFNFNGHVCGYSLGNSVRSSRCQWERQANLNPYWMGCVGVEGPCTGGQSCHLEPRWPNWLSGAKSGSYPCSAARFAGFPDLDFFLGGICLFILGMAGIPGIGGIPGGMPPPFRI